MKLKTFIAPLMIVLAVAVGTQTLRAQSRGALRINEVMVVNDSSVVDDYGVRSAWIELFNSHFGPLEIAKVYITNDRENPTLYPVPIGDVKTNIPKRQHVLFWADGEPNRGTFHTNFVLTPGKENYIALYDADGKTLIDEVVIPADLAPNTTYARSEDGLGEWEVRSGLDSDEAGRYDYITPSSHNVIKSTNSKVDFFRERDENGLGLTVIAMGIVFSALLLVCLVFYAISRIGAYVQKRNKAVATGIAPEKGVRATGDSGEEIAAIVMALNDHLNAHDQESTIITLNRVKKAYSPWSSKIYNLRQLPHK